MGYKYEKEDILKIGYDILRKNGYYHVGINQILKEAGLPKGSFYNFFESKEDFAQQVIRFYGESTKAWLEEYFSREGSPLTIIREFYNSLVDGNEADGYSSGCLINNMSNEIGRLNETLAQEADEHFKQWIGVIAKTVEKGQNAGEITKKATAIELAEYLHAGIYGSFARMKVTGSRTYMDKWVELTMDFIKA
ncbi:MAG: TetR/AcrR family transcriptional regulator [Bacteroidota bacterium]